MTTQAEAAARLGELLVATRTAVTDEAAADAKVDFDLAREQYRLRYHPGDRELQVNSMPGSPVEIWAANPWRARDGRFFANARKVWPPVMPT